MRVRSWLAGAVVCVLFAHNSLSYEDKQRGHSPDMPFQGSVSYSVILSALSGQRTRKRTAMGMDLTDYLWNKAHEKSRAMVLQRMMKNGKSRKNAPPSKSFQYVTILNWGYRAVQAQLRLKKKPSRLTKACKIFIDHINYD